MKLYVRAAVAILTAVVPLVWVAAARAGEPDTVAVNGTFDAAGQHTLVVLPVFWTAPDAQTTTSLRALARQVGDYWSEQTAGALTIPDANITVYDWAQIADPGTCDKEAIFYAARDAANVRAGTYHKHVLVYFPATAYCPWQGTATVGDESNMFDGTYGWIWINGYTSGDVWEREFGHNLSLGHASAAACHGDGGVQVPLSDVCDTRDYQDYDLMGAARGHDGFTLNTALADRIGLLGTDEVRTASVGASFTLSPVSTHTGLMTVKVPLSGSILYIEYRPRTGRDAAEPPGWSGVQVRQRNMWDYFSRVLALSPDGSDGLLANAAARVGIGWRIPGTYLILVVDSQDANGARIRFEAPPDDTPPPAPQAPTVGGTATVSGTAQQDGIIGGDLYLNWPQMDDPESGLASFQVYVDDAVVETVAGTTFTSPLPSLSAGTHRVRVDATNNAGMTTAGAQTSFHCEPAPPVPDAPTVTSATHGSQLSGALTVDWSAVTDPDLAGYQVYVDQAPVGTVSAGTLQYQMGALATGYHTAQVVAVNSLGLGRMSLPTGFQVDASPPAAPAAPSVSAAGQYHGILRGTLQVSWASAQDADSGIASYRVFLGGSLVGTAATAGSPVQVSAPPSGVYQLRVDAVNGAGLTATGAAATVHVDNSAPVLSTPTVALWPGSAAAGTPVTITATAVDTGSGICAVRTTVDGRVVGTGSGAPVRVNATIPASGTATVRVTATDCVGNAATATASVTVATVSETAARYGTGWSARRSSAYAGGMERFSSRAGATATYTFTGTQVAWTGSRATSTGAVTVYLDGVRVATVDTYGPAAHRQLVWATSTRYGRHTVKVVVKGTPRRPTVALDGFVTVR